MLFCYLLSLSARNGVSPCFGVVDFRREAPAGPSRRQSPALDFCSGTGDSEEGTRPLSKARLRRSRKAVRLPHSLESQLPRVEEGITGQRG